MSIEVFGLLDDNIICKVHTGFDDILNLLGTHILAVFKDYGILLSADKEYLSSTVYPGAVSCVEIALIVPYGGITAVFVIISLNTSNVQEIESVKFTDKNGQVKIVVLKDAILYIKANENYITVFYTEGNAVKDYTLRTSMLAITPIADRFGLFRCHKSYFVNPSHIIALRKDVNETYAAELDVSGIVVPVSRNKYPHILMSVYDCHSYKLSAIFVAMVWDGSICTSSYAYTLLQQ